MKLIAIYDFRILPLAVGDILSWLAHQKLNAVKHNLQKFDLKIIIPENFKGNLLNPIRDEKYWRPHIEEMIRIFYAEEYIEIIQIYKCHNDININIEKNNYINLVAEVEKISNLLTNNVGNIEAWMEYIRFFQKFNDFNNEYLINKIKIKLISKNDVVKYAYDEISKKVNTKKDNLIICQPRFRMIDDGLPSSDYKRDSNFIAWYEFFKKISELSNKYIFILVGRIESLPVEFKRFNNIIFSRDLKLNIEHEIALIRNANLFIGASSGFAVVANFSNVNYLILSTKTAGYVNYGISEFDNKLVFSEKMQFIYNFEIDQINIDKFIKIEYSSNKKTYEDYKIIENKSLYYIFKLNLNLFQSIINDKNININKKNIKININKISYIWSYSNTLKFLSVIPNFLLHIILKLTIKIYECYIQINEYYEILIKYNNNNIPLTFILIKVFNRIKKFCNKIIK